MSAEERAPEDRAESGFDLDLGSMRPEDARDYVLAYVTAWKRLQKEIGVLQEQILLWERRVKAARDRSEPQLANSTRDQVERLKVELEKRKTEEEDLGRRVSLLKRRLKSLQTHPSLSVDPQALLAQLQVLLGESDDAGRHTPGGDAVDRALREQEVQAALEELKRRMQG